jgi:hypothetical protein
MNFRITSLALALLVSASVIAADAKQDKAAYERQLSSVKVLYQALQSDPKAATPSVKATLETIATRQKEAEDLAAAGEYDLAKTILNEGYSTLQKTLSSVKGGTGYGGPSGSMSSMSGMGGMLGMTGADGKPLNQAKMKADFDRDLASARSLLDAAKRTDAAAGGKQAKEIAEIESLIGRASAAAAREDYAAADKLIDEARRHEQAVITGATGNKPQAATGSAASAAADRKAERERASALFDTRLSTARSMLSALKSQNTSKNLGRDASIAEIEQKLARAESMRTSDPAGGLALIDQAYSTTRSDLQGMSGGSNLKSGSAAMDAANQRDMSGMSGEDKTKAIASQLRTTKTLRDAYERQCKEKGVDGSATLSRIDKLAGEARALEGTELSKALLAADEAYKLAKSSLEAIRAR